MTSFSATCTRFSQFLKEQQRLAATARPTTTMSLLPGLDVSSETECVTNISVPDQPMDLLPLQAGLRAETPVMAKANLTIFYAGQMLVFEDFPAEKARDLMKMAGKVKVDENSAAPPPPTVLPAVAARGTQHLRRRACLSRFMEERRERIHCSKAPYQVDGSATQADSTKKPAAALPWFLRESQPALNSEN